MNILNPALEALFVQKEKVAALMGSIEWGAGVVRFHNGTGVLRNIEGEDWYGVGELGKVSDITNGERLTLTLNTTDMGQVAEALKDDAVGGRVNLYLAGFNENMQYVTRQLIYAGIVNKTPVKYTAPPAIAVECVSYGYRWNQPKEHTNYNAASQRAKYPNDSFCDDVENVAKGPLGSYSGSQAVGGDNRGSNRRTGDTRRR